MPSRNFGGMFMGTSKTITVEQLAKVALKLDSFQLRAVAQEFLRQHPRLSEINRPNTNDSKVLAVAASLLEMFAARARQRPPSWTTEVGPLPEPMYLIKLKPTATFTRQLCDTEAPEQLRKRNFFAPPNFLDTR
jgi:hypothetical protein